MTERRMNVLFVITDQHRADHVGFMGNEVVRTPNLDAIADRGMVFENAWVANPVCMPNRSTLMTGRMPSAHGVIFNDRSLEWGASTHVRQFRRAGWRTGLFGKSHLQHGMSRNSVMPVAGPGAIETEVADGWDMLEHHEAYADGTAPDWPDDFYGFGTVELSIDHGARITGHHLLWALERGADYDELVVPYSPDAPAKRRSNRWWQIYDPPYDPEFHSTNFVTERTIAFIEAATAADEPWLAWASFPDPHHPMTPPGEWFDRHDPADMTLPASIDDPMEHGFDYLRRVQTWGVATQRGWVGLMGAGDHDLVRQAIAATYGMIEFIDEGVGRIVAAIDRLGQLDDTIVVFTSDHGDMMGDHGLMLKGFMPYRGTQQVSLVVADPRREPGRTEALGGSADLAPTLMEMCGVAGYDGIQGRSLVPVLDDPNMRVHDHLLIEDDGRAALFKGRIPSRTRTLVSADGHKYTRNNFGETMLFDLASDPDELDEIGHRDAGRQAWSDAALADALMTAVDDARGAPVS